MNMKEIVQLLLPTKWSKRIGAMTCTLAIVLFGLPELYEKLSGTKLELRTALEIRIGVELLLLLLGTFIILVLVVVHCRNLEKKLNAPQKPIKPACVSLDPPPRYSITGRRRLS
jgi:hypothetical protein